MALKYSIALTLSVVTLTICNYLQGVQSANILVYGIIGSHSTRISMMPLMEALANKGHNVTYLSPFATSEGSEKGSKVKPFVPKKWLEVLGSWDQQMGFYDLRKNKMVPFMWYGLRNMGVISCEALYGDPEFIEWVKTSPKFDMVMLEVSANECAYGLVRLWNAKLAMYSTTTSLPWMVDQYGLPDETSSVSDTILYYPPWKEMSFLERFVNAIVPIVFATTWQYEYLPRLEEVTRKGLGLTQEESDQLPRFIDVGRNASLVLLTTHFSLDFPRSLPPHVIEIGGIAVQKQGKPLPKDLENFINSGKNGFIYISFGTVADFSTFDQSVQENFINALGHFPNINFVWVSSAKLNVSHLKHVFVTKWAPQQTVLEHSKLKAFITHAGMGSSVEAIHNAVPMICIPVLAEQDFNANSIVSRGAGILVEITTLEELELKHAISEILNNPEYKRRVNMLSKIYKDRQQPPLENAVWWTEYVLRHDDIGSFVIPHSARQSWWKRRQLDVWVTAAALLLLTMSVFLYAVYFFISKLVQTITMSSGNSQSTLKKKQN